MDRDVVDAEQVPRPSSLVLSICMSRSATSLPSVRTMSRMPRPDRFLGSFTRVLDCVAPPSSSSFGGVGLGPGFRMAGTPSFQPGGRRQLDVVFVGGMCTRGARRTEVPVELAFEVRSCPTGGDVPVLVVLDVSYSPRCALHRF